MKLEDAYRFPGFRPLPIVKGVFGDSHARVITLTRREKKRTAALAAWPIEGTTIASDGACGIIPAVGSASTWIWRCAASIAGAAAK